MSKYKQNVVITALQEHATRRQGPTVYLEGSRLGTLTMKDCREFIVEMFVEYDGVMGIQRLKQLHTSKPRRSPTKVGDIK